MMTSKVQPLHSATEEGPDTQARGGGLRRIAGAEASNRDDESLPPVGGSIHVVSHPDGYRFAVRARLEVTLKALLDVVETANTFRATVELGLEFEVSEDQWRGCETFWRDHFIPKVPRVFFANADGRENVFAQDASADERVGRDDVGAPLVDSATGELKRLFRLRRLKTVEFHQPLALQKYPFDYQVLAIRCVAEGAEVFGKYYPVHKSNCRDASPPRLNHDLHTIKATPARWRGRGGLSPLDSVSTVASSPRMDLVKDYRARDSLVDLRIGRGPFRCGRAPERLTKWTWRAILP